ncbi:MAG: MotA/TolQ/ExbB proton channel family protein [Zoogloea sp.]|nr:MotA/TolQ/ExbB proton channel family protein [Zoogloea sp.]MCA0187238.1 MotA/TolQ/ExbB proton channel family protein [Pseudomonadota bacterium]
MFNFDINRGRSRISAVLASGLIALSGATFTGAALAQAQPAPAVSAAAEAAPAPAATEAGNSAAKAAATTSVENPYGIEALWKGSDAVAKTVLLLLLVMSVGSWYVIIVKLLEQTKIGRQAKKTTSQFWNAGSVQQGAENLEGSSPFRFIAEAGIEATKKHDGLLQHVGFNEWVTLSIQRAIERIQSRLQGGLAFLATVGSTAPFVGLFGTVWGIYHALTAIGVAGQASIDKVAGPVGEALIMTAIGLAVAVPAVLGYNWLVRRNKSVLDDVRAFGSDLHSVILASASKA